MEKLNEKHLSLPFLQSETTLFKGPISNTIPDEQTTIGQVLLRIMNGYWKSPVTNVRELKNRFKSSQKVEDKSAWSRAKEKLPYFTVSVSCKGGRDLNSVIRMTQLIQLDIDVEHDLGGQDLITIKKLLKSDPYVVALFQSTSGVESGVKGIVSVNQATPQEWILVAGGLEKYLTEYYQIEQDKKMRSLTQPCFVSTGDVLINPQTKPFPWQNWIDKKEKKQRKNPFSFLDQQKWKYESIDWPKIFQVSDMVIKSKKEKISVQCPWFRNHTKDELKGAGLFRADGKWCFKCHHSHCANKTMFDLVKYFGEDLVSKHSESNETKIVNDEKDPEKENFALNKPKSLKILKLDELLQMEVPELNYILNPILREQGTGMIWAFRGIGKTWFALNIAFTVASGSQFLCWDTPEPYGVLYVDGELPLKVLQERLQVITETWKTPIIKPLNFITPDVQEYGIPDISSIKGQEAIDSLITEEIKLIIFDNISTLSRSGVENEAESWLPLQNWTLDLRRRGIAVLFIHHGNKSGGQRGTSRREDILDTVIQLKRPNDYKTDEGSVFEVHFDKARGIHGDAAKPFLARMEEDENGILKWSHQTLEATNYEKVVNMLMDDMEVKDIAEELGISKTAVYAHRKNAKEGGDINFFNHSTS